MRDDPRALSGEECGRGDSVMRFSDNAGEIEDEWRDGVLCSERVQLLGPKKKEYLTMMWENVLLKTD